MNTATPHIAHEAEVQRQHVRLQLPISIKIRDVVAEVVDWSNSGLAFHAAPLRAKNISLSNGDLLDASLLFEFGSFSLAVPVTCEVRHINADATRIGCRFHNMNERNMSIMHYLVSAYISGDLVQVGDLLDVVSRKNFTTPRKLPSQENLSPGARAKLKLKKAIYTAAIAIASVLMLGYAASSIFERMYVVKAEVATVSLGSKVSGKDGAVVEAVMRHKDAVRLARGMKAVLGFPGYDRYYGGKIYEVVLEDVDKRGARVFILPDESIPAELVRTPVEVKVNVF
jgi:PilZ domain